MLPVSKPDPTLEHRLQMRNYRYLSVLLERHRDLPALHWGVGVWSLVGGADNPDTSLRVQQFEEWCGALRLKEHKPSTDHLGVVRRFASGKVDHNGHEITLVVRADIWPED